MTAKKSKRRSYPGAVYLLYDAHGDESGLHASAEDAWHDAVGPRFRPIEKCRVIKYERVRTYARPSRKGEP